jgi:hypothetical protein
MDWRNKYYANVIISNSDCASAMKDSRRLIAIFEIDKLKQDKFYFERLFCTVVDKV